MMFRSRARQNKEPSKKEIRAAFDAFAPLDRPTTAPEKPKRKGKFKDDELPEHMKKD